MGDCKYRWRHSASQGSGLLTNQEPPPLVGPAEDSQNNQRHWMTPTRHLHWIVSILGEVLFMGLMSKKTVEQEVKGCRTTAF